MLHLLILQLEQHTKNQNFDSAAQTQKYNYGTGMTREFDSANIENKGLTFIYAIRIMAQKLLIYKLRSIFICTSSKNMSFFLYNMYINILSHL